MVTLNTPLPESCMRCGKKYDAASTEVWMNDWDGGILMGAFCEGCTTADDRVSAEDSVLDEPGATLLDWDTLTVEEKIDAQSRSLHAHTMKVVQRHIDIAKAEGSETIALDFEAWAKESVDSWPALKHPVPQSMLDSWYPMAAWHAMKYLGQEIPQELLDLLDGPEDDEA